MVGHFSITLGRVLSGGYMMRLAGRGVVDPVYSAICQRCSHSSHSNDRTIVPLTMLLL